MKIYKVIFPTSLHERIHNRLEYEKREKKREIERNRYIFYTTISTNMMPTNFLVLTVSSSCPSVLIPYEHY